jgi:hypothetical protein
MAWETSANLGIGAHSDARESRLVGAKLPLTVAVPNEAAPGPRREHNTEVNVIGMGSR